MLIGLGNAPSGDNGAAIYDLQSDGTLTHEFALDEQGVMDFHHMAGGEIVVVGNDPTDDWTAGNIYVKAGGSWMKKRTLLNVLHSNGACSVGDRLFVATGAHTGDNATWSGRVFWSDDLGDTWPGSIEVNDYRVMDIYPFGGKLYASGYTRAYAFLLYVSEDNGVTWNQVAGVTARPRHRLMEYDSRLAVVAGDLLSITLIDENGAAEAIATPEPIANSYNVLVAIGADLYVLCGAAADKVYKHDGASWSYHCDLGEACVSLLSFGDQFLIASTTGTDAKILKVAL